MPNVSLHRRNRPIGDAKASRDGVQNQRFGHPILWRAGAMRLDEAARAYGVDPQNRNSRGDRLGHRDVVARTGAGDGFLEAVGIHENIADRTVNIRAELHRQRVIHQHHILR